MLNKHIPRHSHPPACPPDSSSHLDLTASGWEVENGMIYITEHGSQ